MLELGKLQAVYVVKKTPPMSLFVNEDSEELVNSMTLTKQEAESLGQVNVGDEVFVYCYKNLEGKMVATTKAPIVCNGEIGVLEAVETNHYGAFLNWGGYDKDILLPFSEQNDPVKKRP